MTNKDKIKENNITLIKFLLAFVVIFSHSFPITGSGWIQ